MTVLCEVKDLSVRYRGNPDIEAVSGVSLRIQAGQIVGLAGESGSGKTTLASAITRLLPDNASITRGAVWFEGVDLATLPAEQLRLLRWKDVALVPQSAMNGLNPVLTVGEQIADAIIAHEGAQPRGAMKQRMTELLRTMELDPSQVDRYPHELSGGMRQRVMIAMALALTPKLIVMDEPTTALDVVVQAQILLHVKVLQERLNFAVLFITHDLSLLLAIADRIGIMYAGEMVEFGSANRIHRATAHPYTQALIGSFPSVSQAARLEGIPGWPPNMASPPSGCRFHPRCSHRMEVCSGVAPKPMELGLDHWAACHLLAQAMTGAMTHGQ